MFWHVDEKLFNVDELSKNWDNMEEKAQLEGREMSPQDRTALREAKKHM